MTTQRDVLVVGAGPGGSAAAFYLAQAGLDVLLIDRAQFPRDKTCGDALTPRAVSVLADMGVLDEVRLSGSPVTSCRVFAPNRRVTSVSLPSDQPALNLQRFLLDDILLRWARSAGAAFEPLVNATLIEADRRSVRVRGQRGGKEVEFRAQVGVLATGAALRLPLAAGLLPRQPRFMVAGRAYFEGVSDQSDWEIHFDGVPLPGYGWVSPVANELLNIGVGYMSGAPATPIQASIHAFRRTPALHERLAGARLVGAVKSYPLRVDFTTARSQNGRIFAVGEAAGLVNPVTGEGIDYALESGRLAARRIVEILSAGDFSLDREMAYERQLRARYEELFRLSESLRRLCRYRPALNLLVRVAERWPVLRARLLERLLDPDREPALAAARWPADRTS